MGVVQVHGSYYRHTLTPFRFCRKSNTYDETAAHAPTEK